MKILALDTSTAHCSVALWIDGAVDARETLAGQRHSALLLGMIDALLKGRGFAVRDLDGIAYGEGPGSFTGLRIACGVVQGLAFGGGVPVVGVSTLLAMAAGSAAPRIVCCIDARVHEIYHAAYERRSGEWCAVYEPTLCAPAAAPELPGEDWLGCGDGFKAYGDVLQGRYAGKLVGVDLALYPHAREVAALAAPLFAAGHGVSAENAAPLYLRDKVALRSDERANR